MPIFEYEPDGFVCYICDGRIEVLQEAGEEPLKYCPTCGLDVCRLISAPSVQVSNKKSPDKAAEKGFATYKRVGKGQYEKTAGEGPEQIDAVGEP